MAEYLELLNECTDPTTGDFLHIYDASAPPNDKDRKLNMARVALLDAARTFIATQTFSPSGTSAIAAIVNMPSATTAYASVWRLNGVDRIMLHATGSANRIILDEFDNGTGRGPDITIRRNSNGSTPAAGCLIVTDKGNTPYFLWPDDSGQWRTGTANPTNANDTSGTVVGTQTSMAEAKCVKDELSELHEVAARIRAGAAAVRRFVYRNGEFNGEEFEGVITDLAPAYGMDRDEEHPHGKSLNTIQILGDLLRKVDDMMNRLEKIEAKL